MHQPKAYFSPKNSKFILKKYNVNAIYTKQLYFMQNQEAAILHRIIQTSKVQRIQLKKSIWYLQRLHRP